MDTDLWFPGQKMFKAEYYPEEIADALCKLAGDTFVGKDEERPEIYGDYTEALYTILAICDNKYNSEFYRSFYRLLERVTAALPSP